MVPLERVIERLIIEQLTSHRTRSDVELVVDLRVYYKDFQMAITNLLETGLVETAPEQGRGTGAVYQLAL